MKKQILITLLLSASYVIFCQRNIFYVGHSLVNQNMPYMVNEIVKSKSLVSKYKAQIINGSPLIYNWNNSAGAEQGVNFKTDYNNTFNTLVITEAVPLDGHLKWSETHKYAHLFFKTAENVSPSTQCYVYETWHCINSGTPTGCSYDDADDVSWRTRLTTYLPKWESIADSTMKRGLNNTVLVIPAGQAMAALHDSVTAGKIAGYNSINSFFTDDIHLNDLGNYYIACVQFATIFKQSPVGATANLKNQWGGAYNIPYTNTALITKLQEIAWKTVCNYPRSGVNCTVVTSTAKDISTILSIYPNPTNDKIISSETNKKYAITNKMGVEVANGLSSNTGEIEVKQLAPDVYFLTIDQQHIKFVKE